MAAHGMLKNLSLADVLRSPPSTETYSPEAVAVVDWLIDGASGTHLTLPDLKTSSRTCQEMSIGVQSG